MRPEARVAAAIEILDQCLDGAPVEKCLTTWARTHRFAGSKDRAAIRDSVFDALRRRRSYGWCGGADTGRALMIGALRCAGLAEDTVFSGQGYAPPPMTAQETRAGEPLDQAPEPVALDCPDWLWPKIAAAYGDETNAILAALQVRAPVFLRVNLARAAITEAAGKLEEEGVLTAPHHLAPSALEVTKNAGRIRNTRAFADGYVELQDAASQAVVFEALRHLRGDRVLDYCAGGGGKALAIAASGVRDVSAHDIAPARMKDLPSRAKRAGTPVNVVESASGTFDLVFCDAPCSGSGAWRRQPQGKWLLDPSRLHDLMETQDHILRVAGNHVRTGGILAYATCSLLPDENGDRCDAFLSGNPGWTTLFRRQWTPLDGGDGFFLAVLSKN